MHRWLFVGLALMAAVGGVGTALVSENRVKNPSLGLELIAMSEETSAGGFLISGGDRNENGGFSRPSIPDPDELQDLLKSVSQLNAEHTARLKEIVAEYGWPGKRLVGFDGAHAAFLLLQQTDDEEFRAQGLQLMQQLPKGQVAGDDLAVTTDRVAMEQNKPQTYGTQVGCNRETGRIEIVGGLIDEANVDKRRAEVGLEPLSTGLRDARFTFGGCEVGD